MKDLKYGGFASPLNSKDPKTGKMDLEPLPDVKNTGAMWSQDPDHGSKMEKTIIGAFKKELEENKKASEQAESKPAPSPPETPESTSEEFKSYLERKRLELEAKEPLLEKLFEIFDSMQERIEELELQNKSFQQNNSRRELEFSRVLSEQQNKHSRQILEIQDRLFDLLETKETRAQINQESKDSINHAVKDLVEKYFPDILQYMRDRDIRNPPKPAPAGSKEKIKNDKRDPKDFSGSY
jgi:hypothetical protein